MARAVGLIGSLRGKLGNAVFYVTNGVQVSRVYQPVVFNPNTTLQVEQRAKMTLAGRLSKITPPVVIKGLMGDNGRRRRGSFVREAVRAAQYSNNTASIAWDNLSLSHGRVQLLTTHTVTRSDGTGSITLRFNVTNALVAIPLPAGYGLRAVVYFIDNSNSNSDFCVTQLLSIPPAAEAVQTIVQARIPRGTAANFTAVCYVIPTLLSEDLAGVEYSFLGDENDTYIVIDGVRSVAKFEYGESSYIPISSQG